MKLYITPTQEKLNGYLHGSDPNLSQYMNGEIEEILSPHLVNLVEFELLGPLMKQWFDKLQLNGLLKIGGYDAVEFAKLLFTYRLSPEERNNLIKNSKCFLDMSEVQSILKKAGFQIKAKKLEGMYYYFECAK